MIIKVIITIILYMAMALWLASRLGRYLHDVDVDASNAYDNYIKTKHEEEQEDGSDKGNFPGAGAMAAA